MKGDRLFFLTMFLALCSHSVSIDTSSESFLKAAKESYEQIIGTVKQAVSNPYIGFGLASVSVVGTGSVVASAVGNQKKRW